VHCMYRDERTLLPKQLNLAISTCVHLKFRELEAATLPRILNQVDLALINSNYAIEAKLNPVKDSLFIEDADSPYANLLVARAHNKDSPAIKKLADALNTPEVKKFLADKCKGAIVPAF
jgi:D-methionine transport system substrate-binding protein